MNKMNKNSQIGSILGNQESLTSFQA